MFAFPRVIRRGRHENGNDVSEENVEEDASATTTTGSSRSDDVEEEEDPTAYLANFHFAPTHQQECQLLIEIFPMRQEAS